MPFRYTDTSARSVWNEATGRYDAEGLTAQFWADATGTVPASLAIYDLGTPDTPGAVISGNSRTVRADSMWPELWDLSTSRDHMWVQVGTADNPGELYRVFCDADQRLDVLDGRVAALESGSGSTVASVNGATGVVVLDADDLADGTGKVVMTAAERAKLNGIATGATANSSDATLLARTNHTGTQSADTLTDGATNRLFTGAEKTKLSGIATGATANATDSQLRDRASHTGSQAISTITGLQATLDGKMAKGEQVINVKDAAYGAVGDDTADDTAALVAARAAAASAGKPMFLPPGTYKHTGFSVTTSMIGSPLGKTVLHGPQITASTSGVRISDIKFQGTSSTIVISANCSDVHLVNVEFSHDVGVTNHLAWDAFNVDRLTVHDCKFGIGGIQLSSADDFLITGNFWDCQYANVNEPCHISGQSSGVFNDNTITNTATDGVDCYSSGHRCIITNNRFIGIQGAAGLECKVTMSDVPGNSSGPGNKFESTIIANNVFYDFNSSTTSTRTGIFAAYVDSRAIPAFAVTETNAGIIITGNVMEGFNTTDPGNGAIVNYQGIVYVGHNGQITNNTIRRMRAWNGASPVGVLLANDAAGVVNLNKNVRMAVRGNVIAGVEGATGAGIRSGNLDYCQISNNIIGTDDESGITTKLGIDLAQGATLNQCDISGNLLHCNNATGFGVRSATTSVSLVECTVSGNTLRDCGMLIYKATRCGFVNNTINNAANGSGFTLGNSATSSTDCQVTDNRITLGGSTPGVIITNLDGFVAAGNIFKTTTRPIFAFNTTKNGIVANNISRTQGVGSAVLIFDASVSAPDQATTYVDANSNKILT